MHVEGSEIAFVAEGKGEAFGLGTTEGDASGDVSEIGVVCDSVVLIAIVVAVADVDVACCLSGGKTLAEEETEFSFFSTGLIG